MEIMRRLYSEEEGQGMVEYALLVALISVAAIATIKLIGPKILGYFNTANNNL